MYLFHPFESQLPLLNAIIILIAILLAKNTRLRLLRGIALTLSVFTCAARISIELIRKFSGYGRFDRDPSTIPDWYYGVLPKIYVATEVFVSLLLLLLFPIFIGIRNNPSENCRRGSD